MRLVFLAINKNLPSEFGKNRKVQKDYNSKAGSPPDFYSGKKDWKADGPDGSAIVGDGVENGSRTHDLPLDFIPLRGKGDARSPKTGAT